MGKKLNINEGESMIALESQEVLVDKARYIDTEEAKEIGIHAIRDSVLGPKMILMAYYFGNRFEHKEGWSLCAAGETWPSFCLHEAEKSCVLRFDSFFRANGEKGRHRNIYDRFQYWVERERKKIALSAAKEIGIPWEEIEELYKQSS
jgi:hypothetical protein